MKIVITEIYDSYECRVINEQMQIDGKGAMSVGDLSDCPEDAIIGRDLVDCGQVCDLMEKAHAAGKAGEPFVVEVKRDSE